MSGASDRILWLFSIRDAWTNVDVARELGLPLATVDHEVEMMQAHGYLSLLTIEHPSGVSHLNLSERGKEALAVLGPALPIGDARDR